MEILTLKELFYYKIWGNEGIDYLVALGVFLVLTLVFYFVQKFILSKAKKAVEKTESDLDDFLVQVIQNIKPPFYFILSLYIPARFLVLSETIGKFIYGIFVIAVVVQVVLVSQKVIDYAVKKRIAMIGGEEEEAATITKLISQIVKFTLWIIGGLLILQNLGIDVTALIAGFGVGGIAVALAAQNLLGDVFASFSIFMDKPFKVGDSIRTGTDSGVVRKIGIKTTQLKTLSGNELTIPNKDLTDSRIHNLKRIERRRISFNLGVTYNTGTEKMKKIPEIIESIINGIEKAELSRVHFKTFEESSLNFEVAYFADTESFEEHMDIRQEINMKIYEEFEKEGIEFAFPTQTIKLSKD